MTLTEFLHAIKQPEHRFADTLTFIDRHYHYTACDFDNAGLHNSVGSNPGSCKILGLALLEQLSTEDALLAFAEHYQQVLATPDGSDHANIRQLLKHGLASVHFSQLPLSRLVV